MNSHNTNMAVNDLKTSIDRTFSSIQEDISITKSSLMHTFDNHSTQLATKADSYQVSAIESRLNKLETDKEVLGNNLEEPFGFIALSPKVMKVSLPFNDKTINLLSNGQLTMDSFTQGTSVIKLLNSFLGMIDEFYFAESMTVASPFISNGKRSCLICIMQNSPKTLELIEEVKFEEMLEYGKVDE